MHKDASQPTFDGQPPAKGPIAWMAGHSVAANLLMLTILFAGVRVGDEAIVEDAILFDDVVVGQRDAAVTVQHGEHDVIGIGIFTRWRAVDDVVERDLGRRVGIPKGNLAQQLVEGEAIDLA